MKISRPGHAELTSEEQQELERLRHIIERATSDGIVTLSERERINAAMHQDGKVTFEELHLVRTLLQEKVAEGKLTLDYS